MTLWHLAWMFTSIAVNFVLTVAVPFVWGYAVDYGTVERFKKKRFYWFAFRKNFSHAGLPCLPDQWSHGEMVEVPNSGRVCRRCGWLERRRA